MDGGREAGMDGWREGGRGRQGWMDGGGDGEGGGVDEKVTRKRRTASQHLCVCARTLARVRAHLKHARQAQCVAECGCGYVCMCACVCVCPSVCVCLCV